MSTHSTFSDFFRNRFTTEQQFAGFRTSHFKLIYEARRHDVAKMPVNFDEDDIEFLQQLTRMAAEHTYLLLLLLLLVLIAFEVARRRAGRKRRRRYR